MRGFWILFAATGLVWGCSGTVDRAESGSGGQGAGTTSWSSTTSTTPTGTSPTTTTITSTGEGGYLPCPGPEEYPEDCAEIWGFECGFEAHCEGNVAHVSWHEHVMCNGSEGNEEIYSYSCTHSCPEACNSDYSDWPNTGEELVAGICVPTGSGGTGGSGAAGGQAGAGAG